MAPPAPSSSAPSLPLGKPFVSRELSSIFHAFPRPIPIPNPTALLAIYKTDRQQHVIVSGMENSLMGIRLAVQRVPFVSGLKVTHWDTTGTPLRRTASGCMKVCSCRVRYYIQLRITRSSLCLACPKDGDPHRWGNSSYGSAPGE